MFKTALTLHYIFKHITMVLLTFYMISRFQKQHMDIRINQFRMISIFCLGKLVYQVGHLRINLFS